MADPKPRDPNLVPMWRADPDTGELVEVWIHTAAVSAREKDGWTRQKPAAPAPAVATKTTKEK